MDFQRVQPIVDGILAHVSPAWVLAVLLAALNVCVFHIAAVNNGRTVFYLLPFGICGFAAGNLLAAGISSPLPMLGDLHVIEASAGAWVALMLANARSSAATT